MMSDNKTLYIHHERTSVMDTQTIFSKGVNSATLSETKLSPQDKIYYI